MPEKMSQAHNHEYAAGDFAHRDPPAGLSDAPTMATDRGWNSVSKSGFDCQVTEEDSFDSAMMVIPP